MGTKFFIKIFILILTLGFLQLPKNYGQDLGSILLNSGVSGVEAGAKNLSKDVLTNIARSLVNNLASPEVSDLLLGTTASYDELIKEINKSILEARQDITARINSGNALAAALSISDFESKYLNASNVIEVWASEEDLYSRISDLATIREVWSPMNELRIKLEQFILSLDDNVLPQDRMRILELLPLHILVSQMAISSNSYYYNTLAIKQSFDLSNFGSNSSQFQAWKNSLSNSQVEMIADNEIRDDQFKRIIYPEIFRFYKDLSEKNLFKDYFDKATTPLVFQSIEFGGDINKYDNFIHLNNPSNWENGVSGLTRLDGLRWYYYREVPAPNCLIGKSYEDLIRPSGGGLWIERNNNPCNRFWAVEPYLKSTAWPNTILGSFDNFRFWYDGQRVYQVHQKYLVGEKIFELYYPTSLILDRMYAEYRGGYRNRNGFDYEIRDYFQIEKNISQTESYALGLEFDKTVYGEIAGVSPSKSGIYLFNTYHKNWSKIGGPGSDWVWAGGKLYGLSPSKNGIYQYSGKKQKWNAIGGPANKMIGGKQLCATNPNTGNIYMYDAEKDSWSLIGGPGSDWVWAGGKLYGLSPNKNGIYQYLGNGQNWKRVGEAASKIIGGDYLLATDPTTGDIYQFDDVENVWLKIGGPGSDWVWAGGMLYGLSPQKNAIYQYTGREGEWNWVGGPASNIYGGNFLCATNPNTGNIWRYHERSSSWELTGGPGFDFEIKNDLPRISNRINLTSGTLPDMNRSDDLDLEYQETNIQSNLGQNFPNPTNDWTTIQYSLDESNSNCKLILTSADGNILLRKEIAVGENQREKLNVESLSNGIYFYFIQTDKGISEVRKMMILR